MLPIILGILGIDLLGHSRRKHLPYTIFTIFDIGTSWSIVIKSLPFPKYEKTITYETRTKYIPAVPLTGYPSIPSASL